MEKQINELANDLANDLAQMCPDLVENCCGDINCVSCLANKLTEKGYRKQEWISVEDRLPDEDGEYLTYNGLVYYLLEFNTSVQLWNVSTTDISTAIRDVTHWMHLPQPPKMKGAERYEMS